MKLTRSILNRMGRQMDGGQNHRTVIVKNNPLRCLNQRKGGTGHSIMALRNRVQINLQTPNSSYQTTGITVIGGIPNNHRVQDICLVMVVKVDMVDMVDMELMVGMATRIIRLCIHQRQATRGIRVIPGPRVVMVATRITPCPSSCPVMGLCRLDLGVAVCPGSGVA